MLAAYFNSIELLASDVQKWGWGGEGSISLLRLIRLVPRLSRFSSPNEINSTPSKPGRRRESFVIAQLSVRQ